LKKVGSENQGLLKDKIINYFEQKSELELEYYDYNLFIRSKKFITLKLVAMVKNFATTKLLSGLAIKFQEKFYEWQLRLNPEKSLTLLEKNTSKYINWFDALGGYGRKLYRKALKINYTEPQKVDALLRSLMQKDGWCERKSSQQLLQVVEPKIFGDFIVKGSLQAAQLAAHLKNNLRAASLQANIMLETSSYQQLDNNDKVISGIGAFVKNLAVKINYQKLYLIVKATSLYDFKREIYVTMQSERIKLLYLWLMVEALAKGEIFSARAAKNKMRFIDYFQKQLKKFRGAALRDQTSDNIVDYLEQSKNMLILFNNKAQDNIIITTNRLDQNIKQLNPDVITPYKETVAVGL